MAAEPVPTHAMAKLRLEKKGRGGKTVSVVYDLPNNASFLKTLCQELKRACGAGGAVSENTVEIQGDQLARIRSWLQAKGFVVKG
jgi:translation initiation factor 1